MSEEIYIVTVGGFDGLYGFVDEDQRDEFAELHPGADVGTLLVLDPQAGERTIARERASVEDDDEEDDDEEDEVLAAMGLGR